MTVFAEVNRAWCYCHAVRHYTESVSLTLGFMHYFHIRFLMPYNIIAIDGFVNILDL